MDLKKLTKGEQILGGSALLLFILSFLPLWAKVEVDIPDVPGVDLGSVDDSQRFNLWDSYGFMAKLAIFLALVAVIVILVRAAGNAVKPPVPFWQIYLGCAGLALLLMLISALTGPAGGGGGFGVEVSRGLIGLLGGIVLSAAMAFGAYMHMQEEGGSLSSPGTSANPPPPPAS